MIELMVRHAAGEPVAPWETFELLAGAVESPNQAAALGIDQANRARVRNDALAAAAELLNHDQANQWTVAKRLAQAIKRFEVRIWPALKAGRPGDDLEPVNRELQKAFLSGAKIPRTARRLNDLF